MCDCGKRKRFAKKGDSVVIPDAFSLLKADLNNDPAQVVTLPAKMAGDRKSVV